MFRTDDGKPHIVRRFRGGPNRGAVWDGQVSTGPGRTAPAPEGDYAFTFAVRDRAGNETQAPRPIPRAAVARPGTGVSVRRFTLRGPLSAVTAGAYAHLEVGPVDRSFDWVVSRLGDPKAVLHGGRVAGRFRIRIPSKTRTGVYVVRVRVRATERAVWPLAVAGLPPPQRPQPCRARSWCCRRSPGRASTTWTTTPTASRDRLPFAKAVRLDRPFAGDGLPPRFDAEVSPLLRWLDRERLAVRPHHRPRPGASRGSRARQRPGRGVRRQRALGCRSELMERLRDYVADGGRVAIVRGGLVPAHDRPARRHRKQSLEAPEGECLRRADGVAAHRQCAAHGVRGRTRAVRGAVELHRRVHRLRGVAQPAAQRPSDHRRGPRLRPARLRGHRVSEAGSCCGSAPRSGRASSNESALSLELPRVTKRIWRMLSAGGSRLIPLPSCAP